MGCGPSGDGVSPMGVAEPGWRVVDIDGRGAIRFSGIALPCVAIIRGGRAIGVESRAHAVRSAGGHQALITNRLGAGGAGGGRSITDGLRSIGRRRIANGCRRTRGWRGGLNGCGPLGLSGVALPGVTIVGGGRAIGIESCAHAVRSAGRYQALITNRLGAGGAGGGRSVADGSGAGPIATAATAARAARTCTGTSAGTGTCACASTGTGTCAAPGAASNAIPCASPASTAQTAEAAGRRRGSPQGAGGVGQGVAIAHAAGAKMQQVDKEIHHVCAPRACSSASQPARRSASGGVSRNHALVGDKGVNARHSRAIT